MPTRCCPHKRLSKHGSSAQSRSHGRRSGPSHHPFQSACMAHTAGAASGVADLSIFSSSLELNIKPAADKWAPQSVHRSACPS